MKRITVVSPAFSENNKKSMTAAAAAAGYEIMFFEDEISAADSAGESEIIVGAGPDLLRMAPRAKWYCGIFAGVDSVVPLLPEGMILTSAAGAYGITISEHIVMTLLELLRRKPEYNRIVKEKKWIRDLPIRSLYGSRITIMGTGDIGTQTAKRLRSFEPSQIIGVNRSGKNPGGLFDRIIQQDSLEQVLPGSDILILCMPDTPQTRNMLSKERLGMLPQNCYIVNVGRGSAIDQTALTEALNAGRIAGAGLDVFETEPVPEDDPIWECRNLILTPHISGNMTLEVTVDRIADLFCRNLENYCQGRPLINAVDPGIGY